MPGKFGMTVAKETLSIVCYVVSCDARSFTSILSERASSHMRETRKRNQISASIEFIFCFYAIRIHFLLLID